MMVTGYTTCFFSEKVYDCTSCNETVETKLLIWLNVLLYIVNSFYWFQATSEQGWCVCNCIYIMYYSLMSVLGVKGEKSSK